MGWLLVLACTILAWSGWSMFQSARKTKYAGFYVAAALDFGCATAAVSLESWWWVLGGFLSMFVSPFLLAAVFGDPPKTAGPLSYIDETTGRRYRMVEDAETGETRREDID